MPLYDYKCQEHGLFHQLATFEQSADPAACPSCQRLAPRIIMLPPELRKMASENRQAHQRNEQSRHLPVHSTPEYRQDQLARREHRHGKGCGCGDKPIRQSKLFYTADGKKMFPSMRPWMISH